MFKMVVESDSISELREGLSQALNALRGEPVAEAAATTAKRGPGRPAKNPEAAPATPAAPQKSAGDMAAELGLETTKPTPAPQNYTAEQVKAALQELAKPRTGDEDETTGLGRVTTLLAKIGVRMVKDIPADRYAEVITLAQSS